MASDEEWGSNSRADVYDEQRSELVAVAHVKGQVLEDFILILILKGRLWKFLIKSYIKWKWQNSTRLNQIL